MSTPRNIVIAGAGLAGAKAAQTLREEGFDGRIVLLGAEAERPYERPALSKDYLREESDRDRLYVHGASFYDDHGIELRTSSPVVSVHTGASVVVLAGGEHVRYDRLLLATGARPRRLVLPGADLHGIHELRTLADSEAIATRLESGGRVVVIGAGWIGCEVAASARQKGLDVTVIEPSALPLQRALGPELGAFYRDLHADHGVELLLGRAVTAFEGDVHVSAVRTDDGRYVPCDFVVVGVGVSPRVEIAARAGIETVDGILVDEFLQTSARGVYAAGDIARAHHPLLDRAIRIEHWSNALNQGPAAARNMLGAAIPYERLPYFYSDQYDVGMEYTGHAVEWDDVVIRGDLARREFIAFWLRGGRVLAGMNVNVWGVTGDIEALIRSSEPVDAARLADAEVALGDLLPATAL